MNKKILAVSLLSVFAFSFVVAGVSAETRNERIDKEATKIMERRMTNRMATTTHATSTSSFSSSHSLLVASSTVLICIKTAVVARENSIVGAFSGFSASMNGAYQTRLTGLNNAWNMTNAKERKTAVKTAWNSFKASSKIARKTLQNSNKTAWTTFENTAKSCRKGVRGDEAGVTEEKEGMGIDVSVSN